MISLTTLGALLLGIAIGYLVHRTLAQRRAEKVKPGATTQRDGGTGEER